jgi:hypothetical protein
VGNTSRSPAASNIIVACDCGLPLRPAVPRVILNDLGERIGDLVDKEPFPPFFVASYARPAQPKRSQNQRTTALQVNATTGRGTSPFLARTEVRHVSHSRQRFSVSSRLNERARSLPLSSKRTSRQAVMRDGWLRISVSLLLLRIFRRGRGDEFLKARIVTDRIPDRVNLQSSDRRCPARRGLYPARK